MLTENDIKNAHRALPYLVYFAQNRKTTGHADLARLLDIPFQLVKGFLPYIRDEICRANGVPDINTIVVLQMTGKPGSHFMAGGVEHLSRGDYERAFQRKLEEVFTYDKWDDLLKKLKLKKITKLPN